MCHYPSAAVSGLYILEWIHGHVRAHFSRANSWSASPTSCWVWVSRPPVFNEQLTGVGSEYQNYISRTASLLDQEPAMIGSLEVK